LDKQNHVLIDPFEGKRGVNWTIYRVNLIFRRFNNRWLLAQSTVELNDSTSLISRYAKLITSQSEPFYHDTLASYFCTIDLLCHPIIHLAHTLLKLLINPVNLCRWFQRDEFNIIQIHVNDKQVSWKLDWTQLCKLSVLILNLSVLVLKDTISLY